MRYICEMTNGDQREQQIKDTEEVYLDALNEADKKLKNPSILFLTVYLNLAVFLYEIKKEYSKAYQFLQDIFASSIEKIHSIGENEITNLTEILNLMEENLMSWKYELDKNKENN